MIAVIPFCEKDVEKALELLSWIRLLGSYQNHSCLLVADAGVKWWKGNQAIEAARKSFDKVILITTDRNETNWIEGSNSLFLTAAQHIEENQKQPWLWLEPDAVPLKPGWLDSLSALYEQSHSAFLGFIYEFSKPEPPVAPFNLMSGVAIYPPDAWSRMVKAVKFSPTQAFDVACAAITTKDGLHTNLIQHFYGERNLAPTFVERQTSESPRNAYGMDRIHSNAVVFHRCKDNSLISLLRIRLLPHRFIVVFPFCNRDGGLLVKNLRWMQYLGSCQSDTALLVYDDTCHSTIWTSVESEAKKLFGSVLTFNHIPPKNTSPPYAANHVFRCVSAYINGALKRPFLWFEPDMVPVKRNWLERLQYEYATCGKPYFGSVVPGMGHFNGTAIYPSDTFIRCPNIRNDSDAFDMMLRHDINPNDIFDASRFIQCAWVQDRGGLQPHGGGQLPHFDSRDDVNRWLLPTAILFHRDKGLTLVDRLAEMGVE